jgi:hypothetical protein
MIRRWSIPEDGIFQGKPRAKDFAVSTVEKEYFTARIVSGRGAGYLAARKKLGKARALRRRSLVLSNRSDRGRRGPRASALQMIAGQ